jgi:1D-myo-inositol 3-kinase
MLHTQISTPQFLTIGHVTRDVRQDGSFSLGGTVTFASLCASALGLPAGVVSCAAPDFSALLSTLLPGISLHVRPSAETTTFANIYHEGFRTQYLHARGQSLQISDVPADWQAAPIVLLGPLAQELSPDFVRLFPRQPGSILAATPQGWLRRWDIDGRVSPTPWREAEQLLPYLDVLILSHDDLLPFADENREEATAIIKHWSTLVPLLVATDGRHGADLFRNGTSEHFSAYPVREVDPTGAGDVFAAAFLTHLHRHGDAAQAVDFANCVASFSIEKAGTEGIPTLEMVEARRRGRNTV